MRQLSNLLNAKTLSPKPKPKTYNLQADIVEQLSNLLKRKDDTLKLKALGALAQLPYMCVCVCVCV